jgi:cytochrome c oxidase assembly factor CtaG
MGPELLILPLAIIALAVLLGAGVWAWLSRRVGVQLFCGLLWLGALFVLAANYSSTRTLVQNLLLSLMMCGLLMVLAVPVLVIGALVALPFKKYFAPAPGDADKGRL